MSARLGKRILSVLFCLASPGALGAQETILPPAIPATAPPNNFLGAPELPDVSDRALIAPNMYGAVLGTRWFVANGPGFGGAGGFGTGGSLREISGFVRNNVPANASFQPKFSTNQLNPIGPKNNNYQGIAIPVAPFFATQNITFPGPVNPGLLERPDITALVASKLAKPGETTVYNSAASKGFRTSSGEVTIYNIFLVYDFLTPNTTIIVPNPADGGLAGRNRVSTDNSPLPRDRFIFNYDFVSNTNLYPTTPGMNRMVVGFEKTFLGGNASVEFRVPFASTVSSTSHEDGVFGSGQNEFGNLFVILKSLFYTNDAFVVSGGLGLSIPTADDVRLNFGGSDVLKIRNEAFIMTPFVAGLWTPTDRFFAQGWLGFSFDTNGNPVLIDPDGNGLQSKGRLYDPSTLQVDLQLGYWLIHPRDNVAYLRGLAPFVEFHFNHQLQAQNSVNDGVFTVTPSVGQLSEMYLSSGFAAQLGSNANLMIGATVPLTNEQQRFSDWQIGMRLNYYFGPTGRARINAFN